MNERMPTDPFPRALNVAFSEAIDAAEKALGREPRYWVGDREPSGNAHAAKAAVDASWEILAKPWSDRLYVAERYRSVAGDLWNLAHEAIGALGAWDEAAQDWRFDQIEDDDGRLVAIRLSQAIEDYDKLVERERERDRTETAS